MGWCERAKEIFGWLLVCSMGIAAADLVAALAERDLKPPERGFKALPRQVRPATVWSPDQIASLLSTPTREVEPKTQAGRKKGHSLPPELSLQGVMAGVEDKGLAFFSLSQDTVVVNVGEPLPGTQFVLKNVHADRVVLRAGDEHRILLLGERTAAPQVSAEEPEPPSINSRSQWESFLRDPKALQSLRAKPVLRNGEMIGAAVFFEDSRHPLMALGLRSGDVVLSVNEKPIDGPGAVSSLLPILRNSHILVFEIEREGEHETLRVELL